MTKTKLLVFALLLILGTSVLLVWQQQSLRRLRSENARWKGLEEQVAKLKEENARLEKLQANSDELDRLRREQFELLKLRNEVSQLRKQHKEAAARQVAVTTKTNSADSQEAEVSPVDTYSAIVLATVAPHQTLITGGLGGSAR